MTTETRPLQVRSTAAAKRLHAILEPAVCALKSLDRQPAFVADCVDYPWGNSTADYWHGVQSGLSRLEQQHFLTDMDEPVVHERSQFHREFSDREIVALGSEIVSRDLSRVRDILHRLQQAGWRDAALEALDGDGNLLCLGYDYGQPWLCRTRPRPSHVREMGDGDAWTWDSDGNFIHFGVCSAIDNEIGTHCPITFSTVNPDSVESFGSDAKRYFAPVAADGEAFRALSDLIHSVVADIVAITGEPVVMTAGGSRLSWSQHSYRYPHRFDAGPGIWWSDRSAEISTRGGQVRKRDREISERYPEELDRLVDVLVRLENAGWRALFGAAFDAPFRPSMLLALQVKGGQATLVRENSAVAVTPQGFAFSGLRDLDWSSDDKNRHSRRARLPLLRPSRTASR